MNIDFNYLRGVDQIETADAVYMIMFGMGDDTATALMQAGQQPPNLAAFPQGHSSYQINRGSATDHTEDIAALESLCAYYDAHTARMIAVYQQQADNAAHQQWPKDRPPAPPDTVISYWPIKNSVFLDHSH